MRIVRAVAAFVLFVTVLVVGLAAYGLRSAVPHPAGHPMVAAGGLLAPSMDCVTDDHGEKGAVRLILPQCALALASTIPALRPAALMQATQRSQEVIVAFRRDRSVTHGRTPIRTFRA